MLSTTCNNKIILGEPKIVIYNAFDQYLEEKMWENWQTSPEVKWILVLFFLFYLSSTKGAIASYITYVFKGMIYGIFSVLRNI